jgi:hypothetical protein
MKNIIGISLILLFSSCGGFDFEEQTFRGFSEEGTVVALDITSSGGILTGTGFHRFRNCKTNKLELEGEINEEGEIEFEEKRTSNGELFGTVKGKYDKKNNKIVCTWRNNRNADPTRLTLKVSKTSKDNADDILTSLPPCATNDEGFLEKLGKILDGN